MASYAQNLTVDGLSIYTPDQIVKKYLFTNGNDANILNVKYTGGVGAVGAFHAVGTPFGLTSGMILSTGSVFKANGPYMGFPGTMDKISTDWGIFKFDLDAEMFASNSPPPSPIPPLGLTTDPAIIEFDYVSSGNGMLFNFQWGSDEYRGLKDDTLYADTSKHIPSDFFEILVQGKGVGNGFDYVNVGTVTEHWPGIPTPVEVPINTSTVNNGPANAGPCVRCDMYYDNAGGNYPFTSMPGFTGMFTKSLNIIPCDTYHVKIIIVDRNWGPGNRNPYYDSHLFLTIETTQPPVYTVVDKYKIGTTLYDVDTVAYEGCDYAEIRVERYTNIDQTGSVVLTYGGTGVSGTDYVPLPTVINFAVGQRVVILKLEALITPPNTPDRTVIVNNSNEICGVVRQYFKNYFIKKPNLNVNLGPDTTLCEGLILNLNATTIPAPDYYVWNDNTGGPYKQVTKSGLYSVRARIGTCMKSDTISVYFKPLVKFTLGPDSSICFKDTLKLDPKLSLADTAIHYKWNDNSKLPTKKVFQNGVYSLAVTKDGCTSYDTMQLTIKPLPVVDIGKDTSICYKNNPSYTLYATTDPSNTMLWNTGSTGMVTTAYQSGLYWIRVKSNGCYNYDTAKITLNKIPPVNIRDTLICDNYSLKLRAPTGYVYLWNNGSIDSVIKVTNAGTYSVIVNNGPCFVYDTSVVTYKQSPKVNLGNDTALCKGEYIILDATYSGDIVSYSWSGAGNGCGSGFTNKTCQASSTGNYIVTVSSLTNGCINADTLYFFAKPLPTPNLGKDTGICLNQSITISPNCAYDSLFWYDGSRNPTFTYTQPGDYWVKVYKNNCHNIDTLHVGVSVNSPPFTLSHDTGFCKGGSITYDVSCPNCTYLWKDNSITPIRIFKSTTDTWVKIFNANCSRLDSISIDAVFPSSVFPNDTFVCTGKSIVLTCPIKDATVKWWDNSTAVSKIFTSPGKYWLTISEKGCRYGDTVEIDYLNGPVVDLGPDIATCSFRQIILDATNKGNTTYLWNTGVTTPSIKVDSGGLYKVLVTRCGISQSAEVYVDYVGKSIELFVPNAFTPDNNTLNDEFLPKGKVKQLIDYQMSVYNKWGEKLFITNDITKGWDGKINGVISSSDVYVWVIDAHSDCYIDPYFHASGNVTLLK